MAFGFTPKHQETYTPTIASSYWLALAAMAVEQLGWTITHVSDAGLMAHTNQGMFKFNAEITIRIAQQLELQSASAGSEMFDWGKNKKMVQQLIAQMDALQHTPAETLAERQAHLSGYFSAPEEDVLKLPPTTWVDDVKGFLQLFIPRAGYFVTPLLIDLNILLFVLMALTGVSVVDPSSKDLLRWGANLRSVTLAGDWWRLLTCCFIHIGIMHLLMNMYALMFIGLLLEPLLGKWRFISAYILTGVAASIASLWWHDNIVSAGASGAIFGLYGVFLALLTTNFIEREARQALLASIGLFVVYNLIYGMKGGVDNAAHLGGLCSGLLIGYALLPGLRQPHKVQLTMATLAALFLITTGGAVWALRPFRIRWGSTKPAWNGLVNAKIAPWPFISYPRMLQKRRCC
ncbi:MAG: rhomboid family intramembrane serine protease [Chitinophagales bacterium]